MPTNKSQDPQEQKTTISKGDGSEISRYDTKVNLVKVQ